jgi:hypothetical protein
VQIEVIVEGKGSITIAQKAELTRKDLGKLTSHCVDLLKGARATQKLGFGAGSEFHDEVNVD